MTILHADSYSLASYYVESYFNNTRISNATCFFYEFSEHIYLITNWHVVTGKNANTLEHLSNTGAEPDELKISIFKRAENETFCPGYILSIPLFTKEGQSIWCEKVCDNGKEMIDIAIVPVNIPHEAKVFPVNTVEEPFNEDTQVTVREDVFVIGYPFGIQCSSLPIWKRASVASEPCIDVDGKPMMYIDTTTKEGMSGSPVIYKEKRNIDIGDGKDKYSHYWTKFIGVYSGRVHARNIYEAQLGIVWKASIIEKMLSNFSPSSQVPVS